jgi:hypothetical protein
VAEAIMGKGTPEQLIALIAGQNTQILQMQQQAGAQWNAIDPREGD